MIPFPFAFLIGAVGFDIAGVVTDAPHLWRTGGLLVYAGIASALIAAIPGFIDYVYTVPPASTGRARATRHMIVNLSAVALFALTALWRGGAAQEPAVAHLLLEVVGVGLLAAGGWMGGVLVSRNQISVDHRYADAGKWREERLEVRPGESVRVAGADELQVDQMKLLRTSQGRIVLARTESGWVAFDDHCTHHGGSLADGVMICGTVQCPWHGSQFDAATGDVRAGPATAPIRTYAVEERTGAVYLRVEVVRT